MSAAQTIQSMMTLAKRGHPVALSAESLEEIANYLKDAQEKYDEAKVVARAQDAAVAATLRARAYRAEGRALRDEARCLLKAGQRKTYGLIAVLVMLLGAAAAIWWLAW